MSIRLITNDDIQATARAAAEHHIPLREANDFDIGSAEREAFNAAYRARETQLHLARQVEEVA